MFANGKGAFQHYSGKHIRHAATETIIRNIKSATGAARSLGQIYHRNNDVTTLVLN